MEFRDVKVTKAFSQRRGNKEVSPILVTQFHIDALAYI